MSQGVQEKLLTNKVVLRLTDVHPVSVQCEYIKIILSSHLREYFTLNRRGLQLNPVNHVHIQQIQTGINMVAHVCLRLLDELLDLPVFLGDNDTILGGVLDSGSENSAALAVCLVELDELGKRVVANDVGVENEQQARGVILQDVLLSQADWAGSAHRFILYRDRDLHFVLYKGLKDIISSLQCPHRS